MAKDDAKQVKPNFNTLTLTIHDVEEDSVIVNINGWRMRAYFDQLLTKKDKEKFTVSKEIEVNYTGELADIHSVKLLKLK